MTQRKHKIWILVAIGAALSACASYQVAPDACPDGTQKLPGCPPQNAIADARIAQLYEVRTWVKSSELDIDPVELGVNAEVPINRADAKLIGSSDEDGLNSLAAKIWLIENAEHTIDAVYYIFVDDLVGHAMLGALCDAVQRGVDVRIMVDSLGSFGFDKGHLKALESCALDAGFIRNDAGMTTIYRARVQPVIFNAASKIFVNHNRRSHDKLLVVDGSFHDKSAVITGGRNISLAYYGILPDGSPNPDTYADAEIFLRGGQSGQGEEYSVGTVSEIYYSLLFLFKNNKRLTMSRVRDPRQAYSDDRHQFREALATLKALPRFQETYERMPEYVSEDFADAEVRLAHEFGNLTDKRVVRDAVENTTRNPNSIMNLMSRIEGSDNDDIHIVSPYMFAALYKDEEGNVAIDDARNILTSLAEEPGTEIVLLTNSVLTSDNFFTQSIIDMNLVPRLLLSPEYQEQWLEKLDDSEFNPDLVGSDDWQAMVNHSRLRVFETGRLDDATFGGDRHYPKMHAKYSVSGDMGFIGTSNFDYRSRLYNNEMGFFFRSAELADDLRRNTDYLVSQSYRWGSPEWLDMRKRLMELNGRAAWTTRMQRTIYKILKATGFHWYF